eukprot:Plantae.Rhodophyta-Purpureofilum_apyrenoidigerum.ctg1873.p1 GENE.Plantae.Rhodophyta-Purpureofilum_apyrenoidigerum.ctg1873~~Plantae.Rhodophyta-Purpureofilum_apyrenoidigerum.ctg1873.p1  ORF type:complete len:126 (+),score=8.27 Plantae.Rhodophyta-Purpureofilum_apyrenoidigerum.ctg1873:228-605(+)
MLSYMQTMKPSGRSHVLDIKFLCDSNMHTAKKEDSLRGDNGTYCMKCEKSFSSKGNLRVHEHVVHGAKRDFQCTQCTKRFGTKNNLQRHEDMVHKRARPFACSKCNRMFPTKSCVKRHEHTHRSQ